MSLLKEACQRAENYLAAISARRVFPTIDNLDNLSRFRESLPEIGQEGLLTIQLLDEAGSPATVATVGPRYFGFVNGGALPTSVAASWLASAWDQNAALFSMSPIAAVLEEVALGWVRELLDFPQSVGGGLVTGATMANLSALAAARHVLLERAGWDVESDGMFQAPAISVIVGEEAHSTVRKALGLLGFGRNRVVTVPSDSQGRMRADKLPSIFGPTIVCIQAGNVNTGAFDPALEIVTTAQAQGAWVHVDGAFGLWAAASPNKQHLMAGFAQADSWATDAHKWPNSTYDCGLVLLRDSASLRSAMTVSAPYLTSSSSREPMHYTPDSSRRARGVELWAALRSLGRRGMADLVDRTCALARRFAAGLQNAGYKIGNEVVLNQVLVSFGDSAVTTKVIAGLQTEGTCWCGSTVFKGTTYMRISVSGWSTTEADVDASLAAMLKVAWQVLAGRD